MAVRRIGADDGRRVGLAIAGFGAVGASGWRLAGDPAGVVGIQGVRQQPGMVVPLHYTQNVLFQILAGHKPGRMVARATRRTLFLDAADAQARALAQRIEGQPHMLAQLAIAVVQNQAGLLADVAVEEIAERALADEADTSGILFLGAARSDNARAQLANSDQTQAQNRANLGARKASLSAVAAESRRAAADLQRVEELAAKGSVSLRERDQSRATSQLAKANVEKAEADIHIGEQSIKSTQVARASLEAQVKASEAQLGLAQIDLDNTVVRAPRDGQVSESSVRVGQYVAAGSQLLFLVPDKLWVVANFKETQTAHMHVGQRASFTVDALEGGRLNGRIEQIAPATGSEFSVIKVDNASGNFIKIVQRLPIRIAIAADQELAARLRPGMSVEVSVDTRAAEQAAKENAAKTGAIK